MKSKHYLPLLMTVVLAEGDLYAADDETMDFSLESTPASQPVIPSKPLYTSELELGGGYSSEESFKFGEYSGLQNRDGFVIGNLHIQRRADANSQATDYWKLDGRDLGLSSRTLRGEYGQQGKGSVFFEYDRTPHYRWDDAKTPFIANDKSFDLPFGWVAAPTTAGMTELNSSLHPVSIATERQKFKGGASWQFNKEWSTKIKYFHEKKDGNDVISGIFGTTGGNPLASILPRLVNHDTDDVNAELNYQDLKTQVSLRYHLSFFRNLDSQTWQNPFSRQPAVTSYPNGFGRIGLEPDNQAHQFNVNFGHNFSNSTARLAGAFSYGWMRQNQDFLPYTVNSDLTATTPLPRNSLDGDVNNLHGNLTFTARPFKKTDIKARYTYTERDNQNPMNVYTILRNDSEDQTTDPDSAERRINLPYNYRKHKTQFDIGYRLFATSKLTAGYDFERVERDYAEVANTNEHTGRLKLTANPLSFMTTRLEYAHAMRNGSPYRDNKLFSDSHTQAYLFSLNADSRFSNNPLLRKFQYADRTRDKVIGNVTFLPTQRLTLGLTGGFTHDNYEADFGLSEQNRISGTLDISYHLNKYLDLHGFYTQEYFLSRQNGFRRRTTGPLPPLDVNNYLWHLDNEDDVYSAGAGINWTVIENKLDVGLDYFFSRAVTQIDPTRTSATAVPLPSINTELHGLTFRGDYHLKDNLRLRLSYRYESLFTTDFARDNVAPDTISSVLSLGPSSPDYNAHVFGVSMLYNF